MKLEVKLKNPKCCGRECPYLEYITNQMQCRKYRKISLKWFVKDFTSHYIRPKRCIKEHGE